MKKKTNQLGTGHRGNVPTAMKKLVRQLLVCTFLCLCGATIASAQQKKVTGTVTDSSGRAIGNASVTVKGAKNGVATGPDGSFTIAVDGSNAVLVISSINFKSKQVQVGQGD